MFQCACCVSVCVHVLELESSSPRENVDFCHVYCVALVMNSCICFLQNILIGQGEPDLPVVLHRRSILQYQSSIVSRINIAANSSEVREALTMCNKSLQEIKTGSWVLRLCFMHRGFNICRISVEFPLSQLLHLIVCSAASRSVSEYNGRKSHSAFHCQCSLLHESFLSIFTYVFTSAFSIEFSFATGAFCRQKLSFAKDRSKIFRQAAKTLQWSWVAMS